MYTHNSCPQVILAEGRPTRPYSIVHRAVFCSDDRYQRELAVINRNFPPGTQRMSEAGGGWLYSFHCEFGNLYRMYIYHDGSIYQVMCVHPEMEGRFNVHNCHLLSDGKICLTRTTMGGYPDFETTYAKSVLWATGFSVFLKTGTFPFSINNDND